MLLKNICFNFVKNSIINTKKIDILKTIFKKGVNIAKEECY